ncbi:phage tail tape measure protein, partial [Vibrio vulnificus]|uniref:phage tail tape measure protein n=1 Tax=Vibrio vulnificus TaxID=672 RepID=UPI0024DFDA03
SDVLTATFTTANTNLTMLGETMKYVAPVARQAGMSLEETAAMAGLLGNVGIKSSQAGTTLRAMVSRLAAPTGAAAKTLERLGVSTKDASGDMRNMVEIIGDIEKKNIQIS